VRAAYARNSQASQDCLDVLRYDGDLRVVTALTQRRRLSLAILTDLSRDFIPQIRRSVAARRGLPRAMLERLLADPDLEVRLTAAHSHRLPAAYLARCARSAMPAWRQVAAVAPRLDPRLQIELAQDPCWDVRRYAPLANWGTQPLEVAMAMALAPELAADEPVAQCLAAQIAAFASTHPTTSIPRAALVDFLRSPAPAIREVGRRLALNARRARAGADAATATGIAA
jgi:hypothetical protein